MYAIRLETNAFALFSRFMSIELLNAFIPYGNIVTLNTAMSLIKDDRM